MIRGVLLLLGRLGYTPVSHQHRNSYEFSKSGQEQFLLNEFPAKSAESEESAGSEACAGK